MTMLRQQAQTQSDRTNGPGPISFSDELLRNIVLRHQVSYDVWPEWSGCGGRARRIGYCVSLCGVNDGSECGRGHHVPGCIHCSLSYDELRKIAEWITLKVEQNCRCEIQSFDRAWHIGPRQRSSRNEIVVTVKILHLHNVDSPIEEAQEHCLKEICSKLGELGIREGVWQSAAAGGH